MKKAQNKTQIELLSEQMGIIFTAPEDLPDEAPEEMIEYEI